MVVPFGSPKSLIKCLVILAPGGTVNSATSALANVRHFTLDTSASQHHLVDVAGGDHFFIDNRADVETFRHTDIVDILHLRNSLFHSHAFGGETGQRMLVSEFPVRATKASVFFSPSSIRRSMSRPSPLIIIVLSSNNSVSRLQRIDIIIDDFHLHIVQAHIGRYGQRCGFHP